MPSSVCMMLHRLACSPVCIFDHLFTQTFSFLLPLAANLLLFPSKCLLWNSMLAPISSCLFYIDYDQPIVGSVMWLELLYHFGLIHLCLHWVRTYIAELHIKLFGNLDLNSFKRHCSLYIQDNIFNVWFPSWQRVPLK